jgi:hypothetical protein
VSRLTIDSRIDRRHVLLCLLASAGALAMPKAALSVAAPEKAYAGFFLGQGGYWFSWGMPYLASQAQELGMETDIYEYTQVKEAWAKIKEKKKDGYKIALVGFSLGNTTITWLQHYLEVDLLLSIAESSLGNNHPINRSNTKRSVLWYGPDFLSNAGLQDGFDETNYVNNLHLAMNIDPRVVSGVLGELRDLMERKSTPMMTASLAPVTRAARADTTVNDAGPTGALPDGGTWKKMQLPIRGDITCRECWGFGHGLSGLP